MRVIPGTAERIFMTGKPGCGKSAMVREVERGIVKILLR